MLMEDHDGKLLHANVKELERSIAASNHELVLVNLGPGKVVYRIVCIESAGANLQALLVSINSFPDMYHFE